MEEVSVEAVIAENRRRLAANRAPYEPGADNGVPDEERIKDDFAYWAAHYAKIKNKEGGADVAFILNRPQRRLVAMLDEMRRGNRGIRLILLKARQWGGSTCVQLYMAWLQLVHQTGLNSLIVAHQSVGSDEIKDMFDRMLREYPAEKLNLEKGQKRIEGVGRSGSMFRIPARNCKVKVATAERPDACRGGDYSLVHCSEVGIWKRTLGKSPEMIVRSACSGILNRPMTMIVYESTANGTGNFFHREYEAAVRGESQFRPMFVPWYEIDQYAVELSDEEEEELARRLVEGRHSEASTSDRRQPGAYMWGLWQKGATLQALAWYELERSKYSDHALMAAEYPSDQVEAFVHSGARVLDKYRVEALRAGCRVPLTRGEIERGEFVQLDSGGWEIWRHPDGGGYLDRYLAVVDVGGRSLKSDWSVIVVFDLLGSGADGVRRPEVVAQWRGHTDFDILAQKAAWGAAYYDNALLVIESNTLETHDLTRAVDGDHTESLLGRLKEAYPNLYARAPSEQQIAEGAPTRYGFHTNTATKPAVIDSLVRYVRDGLYVERDEKCLDEFLTYERKQNGSYGAIDGAHDDLLMTRAIGLYLIETQLETPRPVIMEMPDGRGCRASDGIGWDYF